MSYEHLTTNFTTGEFLVSSSYPELVKDVKLFYWQVDKLYYLCAFLLQPLRDKFGPVVITSGYRPPELNAKVGGVPTSQHARCEAVDFVTPDTDAAEVYEWILKRGWPGEIILYLKEDRLHVSLPQRNVKMDQFIKG